MNSRVDRAASLTSTGTAPSEFLFIPVIETYPSVVSFAQIFGEATLLVIFGLELRLFVSETALLLEFILLLAAPTLLPQAAPVHPCSEPRLHCFVRRCPLPSRSVSQVGYHGVRPIACSVREGLARVLVWQATRSMSPLRTRLSDSGRMHCGSVVTEPNSRLSLKRPALPGNDLHV